MLSQQRLIKSFKHPSFGNSDISNFRVLLKLISEFWGFCVNSPSSLVNHDSIFLADMPAGFPSAGLLGSATDGSTSNSSLGEVQSLSHSWDLSHVGKHIVMWKPGEEHVDDSIYEIISVLNDNTAVVNINSGGGTLSRGHKLTFSTRDNIYFRVIDFSAVASITGWADDQDMVLTFSGSSNVNADQQNSQVNLINDAISVPAFRLQASPSGSWDGSTFSDATQIVSPLPDIAPFTNASQYFSYLAASSDHLICYTNVNSQSTEITGFHIEIPQRLHPKMFNPNPMAFMPVSRAKLHWAHNTNAGLGTIQSYGLNMHFILPSGTAKKLLPAHKQYLPSLATDIGQDPLWYNFIDTDFQQGGRHYTFDKNIFNNSRLSSDVIYYDNTSGSFSFASARLRKARTCNGEIPIGLRFGRNWIHFRRGVLLPWDGSDVPLRMFYNQ